jgi:hypothetical protein
MTGGVAAAKKIVFFSKKADSITVAVGYFKI